MGFMCERLPTKLNQYPQGIHGSPRSINPERPRDASFRFIRFASKISFRILQKKNKIIFLISKLNLVNQRKVLSSRCNPQGTTHEEERTTNTYLVKIQFTCLTRTKVQILTPYYSKYYIGRRQHHQAAHHRDRNRVNFKLRPTRRGSDFLFRY